MTEDDITEDEEHTYLTGKFEGKLPNLDDFGKSYKDTIEKTKKFYNKNGDLTEPFKKIVGKPKK